MKVVIQAKDFKCNVSSEVNVCDSNASFKRQNHHFYSKPRSAIFKMAAVLANFDFQIGSLAEIVLHDIYMYNYYARCHAFTTF